MDDFGTTSLSAAVPVQPPPGPHGARLGFISRQDVHAGGKQCSSSISYPTWVMGISNTRVAMEEAVAPAASPRKPALCSCLLGFTNRCSGGTGRTLFLPGGCQWNYFPSNNYKRIHLLTAHPTCRNISEGRNWLCRARHFPPARVWRGGLQRNLLLPCSTATVSHLFVFYCQVCSVILCNLQSGTSSGCG